MGCINATRSRGSADDTASRKRGTADCYVTAPDGHRDSIGLPFEIILPDPDLGWRRVEGCGEGTRKVTCRLDCIDELGEDTGVYGVGDDDVEDCPSGFGSTASQTGGAQAEQSLLAMFPGRWRPTFFNIRTRQLSYPLLPYLALNIALRAAVLAVRFGVLFEPKAKTLDSLAPSPPSAAAEDYSSCGGTSCPQDFEAIYKVLSVPCYKWVLLDGDWPPTSSSSKSMREGRGRLFGRLTDGSKQNRSSVAAAVEHTHQNDANPNSTRTAQGTPPLVMMPLQKMQSRRGKTVLADCAAIGMNIADQLFRLERSQEKRSRSPNEIFGWRVISVAESRGALSAVVASPEKQSFYVVPEELVMNVACWVQDTYLTQSAF